MGEQFQHLDMAATRVPADRPTDIERSESYSWLWQGYGVDRSEMPLAGYSALLAAYVVGVGLVFGSVWPRRDRTERIGVREALLFGIAIHKIGRIVTKDWVTSPLRAPFTRYHKSTGGGEVEERSRGQGIQRAIGDLVTCPWCIAPWIAAAMYATFLANPAAARFVATAATSVAVSDSLQHAYSAVKRLS